MVPYTMANSELLFAYQVKSKMTVVFAIDHNYNVNTEQSITKRVRERIFTL